MPFEHHICFDAETAKNARLAEENKNWVPNIVQEAYHSLMDKSPVYPKGTDACGPMPQLDEGFRIEHTDIFSNSDPDQMTLRMSGLPLDFHVKRSLRMDIVDSDYGKFVRLPGEIKPGVPNMMRVDDTREILTFK
jgi:hypothetical protein